MHIFIIFREEEKVVCFNKAKTPPLFSSKKRRLMSDRRIRSTPREETTIKKRLEKIQPFYVFDLKSGLFVMLSCLLHHFTAIPMPAYAVVIPSTTAESSCFVRVLSRERKEKRRVTA